MVQQMDVCNAFLNAQLPDDSPVYMYCVKGFEKEGYVIKLNKALYGLKNAPQYWFKHLRAYLEKLGLVQCALDACMFMLQDSTGLVIMLVGVHVDDLIIVGVTSAVLWFKQAMIRNFKMEDLGWPTRCLGVDIIFHNNGSIQLTQATYIKKLLQKFNMVECKTMPTPMCVNASFTKEDEEDNLDFPYRELVASLLYAAIATMPDLAYTVKELSRFLTRPGKKMKERASVATMRPHYHLRIGRFLRAFMVIKITGIALCIDAVIRVPKYSQDPEPMRCIEFR